MSEDRQEMGSDQPRPPVSEGDTPGALLTCETCLHWRFDEPDAEFDDLRFGTCKAIRQRETIQDEAFKGQKDVDRWTDEGEAIIHAAMKAAKAIAVDGSGYYAAVRTAPDFGCVLHSPKAP